MDYFLHINRNESIKNETKHRVQIKNNPFLEKQSLDARCSQIFPLDNSFNEKIIIGNQSIVFLFTDNPFVVVGKIFNDIIKIKYKNIFLSHGCASIIIFLDQSFTSKNISALFCNHVNAYEYWEVQNGNILETDYKIFNYPDFEIKNIIIHDEFNFEMKDYLFECSNLINRCKLLSNIYIPKLSKTFDSLIDKVNLLLTDYYTSCVINTKICQLQRKTETSLLASIILSINSALTYFLSQAFSGIIPIVENKADSQSFSLLGFGLSINAIFSIYDFIYYSFEINKIYPRLVSILEDKNITFLPFQPKTWTGNSLITYNSCEDSQDKINNYHIIYFSARWGFHESLSNITAAIQSVRFSAKPEWNLLTLTHEFMHAHTRAILNKIKYTSDEKEELTYIAEIYNDREKLKEPPKYTLRTLLNVSLLNFAFDLYIIKILKTNGEATSKKLNADAILKIYKEYDNVTNEIISHTLDYMYFYHMDPKKYIYSLWSSWGEVPKVFDERNHYLLRTLATISIRKEGSNIERLINSTNLLRDELNQQFSNTNDPVIASILEFIKEGEDKNGKPTGKPTKEFLETMRGEFDAYVYLADLTNHCFYYHKIKVDICSDNRLYHIEGSEEIEYNLDDFCYDLNGIDSPIAFLLDRLFKNKELDMHAIPNVSLWEHCVISSTKQKKVR